MISIKESRVLTNFNPGAKNVIQKYKAVTECKKDIREGNYNG